MVDLFQNAPESLQDGRFTVGPLIGTGATSRVHRAIDQSTGGTCAVKLLEGGFLAGESSRRFLAEARAMADLQHPNVLRVFAVGRQSGIYWYAMDYLPGGMLSDRFEQTEPIPTNLAVCWVDQALSGLSAIHGAGLVHRDIKPGNLGFDAKGTLKILDFGAARHPEGSVPFRTMTGSGTGSAGYAAPEVQRDAHHADPRSDVYSVGMVLYESLTGAPSTRLLYAEPEDDVLRGVAPALRPIVLRATSPSPDDRYPSARAFSDALWAGAATLPNPPRRPSAAPGWFGHLARTLGWTA